MTSPEFTPAQRLHPTVFLAVAVVLIVSVFFTYLMGDAVLASNQAVIAQQQVIDQLHDALSTLKDAETGQRGYLLTGEERYLQPYLQAKNRIHDDLAALDALVRSQDLLASDVSTFKALTKSKLDELEHTVSLRRDVSFDAALAEVRTDKGQVAMSHLRDLTASMVTRETAELQDRQRVANRYTYWRTFVFAAVTLLNLAFLGLAYLKIDREIRSRATMAEEVYRQKELLAVTLASIGDGVIVTDSDARITYVNEVAEKLTGWSSGAAVGRPCAEVFNIINEASRLRVESPVDKVLRVGRVVGLANHTLLIRKDSGELPIDDSGAPVRGADGAIRGVILVFRDFSEYKKAESKLIQAREAAEEANIAKDNFLATLSHELRTPLTPVLATLSAWESNAGLNAEQRQDVQMMRRNLDLEARLIDDLLDLTRIVRGKLSLNPEVVDVHELVRSVAGMYQSEIRTKELQLSVKLDAGSHFVCADPARLQQVFWNILKNATKFTHQGGRIDLATNNDDADQVRVTFRDDGIGISAELLSKLFLPFEQGTDETVRRYGGLGLGMAISKALMDAQGGFIAADSAGTGQGALFTVGLPCVKTPDRKDGGMPSTDIPASALRILLVEDHEDTARIMSRLLRTNGHAVFVAVSVAAALESAAANSIEIIVSDIGLPDGTGIDLITQLRKTNRVPAIALTGFGMEEDVARCLEAGFDSHLTKPVNLQKLELAIRQLASRKK